MNNRKVIDKEMVREFGSKIEDSNSLRNAIYSLSDYIDDIALDLSQINQLIKIQNIELILAGDYLTGTAISNSELDFYLAIKSPQIELNSIGLVDNKIKIFWNRVVNAWKNRKRNTRSGKRKALKEAKKREKELTMEQLVEKKEKPYTLQSLKNDFYIKLVDKLMSSTVLYNQLSRIRLLAKDEFGFKINIYTAIKHDDGLKIWDSNKEKFVLIKLFDAKLLLEEKSAEIQDPDTLYSVIRIFKNLYFNMYQSYSYQFVESLVYNCPNSLFVKSASHYDSFIKVLNYLNNTNISNYRSIYDDEQTIYEHENISLFAIRKFIKEINSYLI